MKNLCILWCILILASLLFLHCHKTVDNNLVLYPSPDDPTISFSHLDKSRFTK